MKKITTIILAVIYTANIMAQVPNYVPTNGLVGWWPFNGNANDVSGNGNNGTVNGATLTMDRFGNSNKAYSFDGIDDYIKVAYNNSQNSNSISIAGWMKIKNFNNNVQGLVSRWNQPNNPCYNYSTSIDLISKFTGACTKYSNTVLYSKNIDSGVWIHFIYIHNESVGGRIFLNGILVNLNNISGNICSSTNDLIFGAQNNTSLNNYFRFLNGNLDDIGIWNRVLTDCEISDLFNSQLSSFKGTSIKINPLPSVIGSNLLLTTLTSQETIQWQSNSNEIGWVNLVNNSKYNGVTNDTLVVSNIQVSNHNQAFRAIACNDTSNITYVKITDTCITKINDTIKVTKYDTIKVTDTLVINATLSGVSAPNNTNRLIVYPNPTKDHITIDYGVFRRMNGYTLKIVNTLGQVVFSSPINQQSSYINLSTWTGKGMYNVQIFDLQNNLIENRKIVLQ